MEEKKTKSIESMVKVTETITGSFAKLKFVVVACLVAVVATAVFSVYYSISKIDEIGRTVIVLDKGQALSGSRQDVLVNRRDEVEEQSKRFHTLFFTASPNREVVNRNVESALRLCNDRSVYNYFNDVQESGFYRRIAQSQSVQEVQVDSVVVDMRSYPYRVATFASLFITRPTAVYRNLLVTRMNMIDVPRDPTNLNGLKIENFEVIRNDQIENRSRNN